MQGTVLLARLYDRGHDVAGKRDESSWPGGNENERRGNLKLKARRVVTTVSDTSLLDITKQLRMHGIGCIVITSSGGKVIGIVSERDIVREIARAGSKVLKEPVETYMTKAVVTCRESDTIDRLMAEMTAHRFRHMPVVERGRLIGLVSIGDVVKMQIAEAEMEVASMRTYITTS